MEGGKDKNVATKTMHLRVTLTRRHEGGGTIHYEATACGATGRTPGGQKTMVENTYHKERVTCRRCQATHVFQEKIP